MSEVHGIFEIGEIPPTRHVCPECQEVFFSDEDFGVHIERHRPFLNPVFARSRKKGMENRLYLVSRKCRKGCGRFLANRYERREHEPFCHGEPGIEIPKRAEAK